MRFCRWATASNIYIHDAKDHMLIGQSTLWSGTSLAATFCGIYGVEFVDSTGNFEFLYIRGKDYGKSSHPCSARFPIEPFKNGPLQSSLHPDNERLPLSG